MLPAFNGQNAFFPEIDCYLKDGTYVYRLAIPGVDPQQVDLSISGNEVRVKGQRTAPEGVTGENWYLREFWYGPFERTFTLPEGVEAEKVNATFANGVLEISAPVVQGHLPKRIEIKQIGSGEGESQLRASA